jgi:hypothetical protein
MTLASFRIWAGALRDHSPEVDHYDAVADTQHQPHVMVDEQDTDTVAGQRAQAAAERQALVGVQSGGGLVHEDQTRALSQRAGHPDELALPVGEFPRVPMGHRVEVARVPRPCHFRTAPRSGRNDQVAQCAPDVRLLGGNEQVLLDRQVVEQLDRLKGADQAAARDRVGGPTVERGALEGDVAGPRRQVARQGVDERRLAGPVGADEPDDLALRHSQRDVVDRDDGPIGHPKVHDL